jgi:hypothetical protein
MMRYISGVLVALFHLSNLLLAAGTESAPDFSNKYPPVSGFLNCINLHTNAARNLRQTNFVVVTEFYRMDRIGGDMLRYVVAENGQAVDSVDDGIGAARDLHRKQLSKVKVDQLRSAVARLPRTNQYPWLSSLVIVSHREGTNWVTHSYARHRSADDPPEARALRDLLDIIGARREAQEVHRF